MPVADFRSADMLDCARAVLALNEHARAKFSDANDLAEYMVNFAYANLADAPGYGGTFGFYITSYHVGGDTSLPLRCVASISPSLIP